MRGSNRIFRMSGRSGEMKYMLVRHKVADFETWKKVFDSHAEDQKKAGFTLERVMRNTEDPKELFLLLNVSDSESARAFVTAPAADVAADQSGVLDVPDCWYLD